MRLKIIGILLVLLNVFAAIATPSSLAGYTPWLTILPIIGILGTLGLAIMAGLRSKYAPRFRSIWYCLILASGLSLVGSLILAYYEFLIGYMPLYYPSLPDILHLLAYLPIIGALLLAARQGSTYFSNNKLHLRYLPPVVATVLLLVLWLPSLFTSVPLVEKIFTGTTLVFDILLAVSIWAVYKAWPFHAVNAWQHPWLWLATGTLFILLADVSFAFTYGMGLFNPALDLLWLLAYSAWMWAAVLFISTAKKSPTIPKS